MKIFIFSLFLTLFTFNEAEEWSDHLILSSQACDSKAYDSAIFHIDLALSKAPESEIIRLKIQKAKFLRDSGKYKEAIDYIEELENLVQETLNIKQQIECVEIKTVSYAKLQDTENARKYFYILSEIDPRVPKFTHTEDCIIISNYEQIPNFRNFLKCTFVHSEIAEKAEHIQFHDNGICVVKKMYHCGCQRCEDRPETFVCDCCGKIISRIEPKPKKK